MPTRHKVCLAIGLALIALAFLPGSNDGGRILIGTPGVILAVPTILAWMEARITTPRRVRMRMGGP